LFRIDYRVQGIAVRIEIPDRTVFVPNLVTPMVASQFRIRKGETVCDLSTGSGFHAIAMAKLGAKRVYGIDISRSAIEAARHNAKINGVADRCVFLCGSMFDPLENLKLRNKMDFIVSTLPNAPVGSAIMKSRVMKKFPKITRYLGAEGGGALPNMLFVRHAHRYLSARGRIQLHLVDWSNDKPVLKEFQAQKYHVRTLRTAYIPWYGRRCNIRTWLRHFPRGGKRHYEFLKFPKREGATTKLYLASKSARNVTGNLNPAVADIEWGRVPASWR